MQDENAELCRPFVVPLVALGFQLLPRRIDVLL